jgi:hypothetical protein
MEPASLSVSVVTLASVFDTALDCFKYVQVAESFGSDYQTYILRLQSLRLRLFCWGEAVGLGTQPTVTDQPRTSALSETGVKQAEALVGHIVRLFSDTEGFTKRYASAPDDRVVTDEDSDDQGDAGRHCQKMRKICVRRQQETSALTEAKWSYMSRDKFVELVGNMQSLVDMLPAGTGDGVERNLCDQEARELSNGKALPTLQTLPLTQDTLLTEAIAKPAQGV